MCLILFALNEHPDYPFGLIANRDEFYERPALPLGYWNGNAELLAGKDLSAGGTWLGLNVKSGSFSALTNYRDLQNIKANAPTRGKLTHDYLMGHSSEEAYIGSFRPKADAFNGFNLLCGNLRELYHYSNVSDTVTVSRKGIHGLSNALFDTPWPKVEAGKEELSQALRADRPDVHELFSIMESKSTFPDASLPDTGVGLEKERMLSAKFIVSPNYGTRCTTVMFLHKSGALYFAEKTFVPNSEKTILNEFRFQLDDV